MVLLGSFISFKAPKYLVGAMEDTLKNQATALMIYLGAPQTTKRSDPAKWHLEEFKKNWNNFIKTEHIIVHAPYIVNLANFEKAKFAIDFLTKEIQMMNLIGAKYLVLHPGASDPFEFIKNCESNTILITSDLKWNEQQRLNDLNYKFIMITHQVENVFVQGINNFLTKVLDPTITIINYDLIDFIKGY